MVAAQKRQDDEAVSPDTLFDPQLAEGQDISYPRDDMDRQIAMVLNKVHTTWSGSNSYVDSFSAPGQGPIHDTINALFGTSGIYSIRANADTHPLAQLSTLGKGMMYASLRNFAMGSGISVAGGISKAINDFVGTMGKVAGEFISTVGLATMAMAFVLCYVLPFLPFMYFMFALSGWLKAIFEAIVAMPLWALAHIRIDGEGLAGPGASQGYFLILEIFLRPILIVFGLLASIQIFSALVSVLNEIFPLMLANVGGFDRKTEAASGGLIASLVAFARGPIDQFFFTVLYVILCYMMGLGCFKMIDFIPNTILRWVGLSLPTITEQANDGAGAALERSYQAATLSTQKVQGGALAAILAK
jgi:conjugal transfer/type IV secretion protein DotA/TraY